MPDEVVIVDSDGEIRYVSQSIEEMSGYTCEELVGKNIEFLVPLARRAVHVRSRTEYQRQPGFRKMGRDSTYDLHRKNQVDLSVVVALSPIVVDDVQWIVAAVHEQRPLVGMGSQPQRSTLESAATKFASAVLLANSEERFRLAFEDNMAPMIFTDLDDRVIAANDAFCRMIGSTKDEVLGFDSKPFTFPEDVGITEAAHRRVSTGEIDQVRYVKRYRHKDGRVIFVEVSKSPARDSSGETLYYVISERDVTDRIRRDRLLKLFSEVNRLASNATNERLFLQQLCDALVDMGGYKLAWIGIPSSQNDGGVRVLCSAGETDYLFDGIVSWWETRESGHGPTGVAVRTGTSQVVGDLARDSIFQLWRERASRYGFGSSAAIPSLLDSQVAVLNLYDPYVHAFDEVTLRGLEDLVNDARFAIAHVRALIETRAALERATAANAALTSSEQRFRLAFEENMAPMVFTDFMDRAIAVNDAFCAMVGFTRDELLGHDSKHFTFPDDVGITEETHVRLAMDAIDQVRYVKRYLRKDGRVVVSEVSRSVARDESGEILYFVSSERDVTAEKSLTEQLSHQALHDTLTGLANRSLFEDRLSQAHSRITRQGGIGAVLLVDLDDFKGVNDSFGHLIGDQLLVGIARRFELVTRSSDTICRLGSDQFLYLAEGLTSAEQAEEVARRLLDVLTEPFMFSGVVLEQHASIGVVVMDSSNSSGIECIQEADVALYEAKKIRKGNFLLFSPKMHEAALTRFSLIQELRKALHAGELAMHYQPIVNLLTNEVLGFEALMRWHHAKKGWIAPDVFIPLAEQSELIVDLGAFALDEALRAASSWTWTSPESKAPYVTVNFSAHQFHDPGLVKAIEAALERNRVAPERLIVEITESVALLDASETTNTMALLRDMGVGIALDDFGTGYSSLAYLALWRPGVIKIDRSFVSPAHESDHARVVLETIISLGLKLNTTVLAEGIETMAQLRLLRQLGCRLGQGYLFSRAMAPQEVGQMLARSSGNWWGEDLHFQPHLDLPYQ
ncbi:MAG: EAL domain-containing protein [Acidimicrobiaceae bacterium]|nr:EAL domain-containing protein [Acidimicrobiaceae bacterium]